MIRSLSILSLVALLSGLASARTVKCRLVAFEKVRGAPTEVYAASTKNGEFIKNRLSLSVDAIPVEYPVPASGKLVFFAEPNLESKVIATATIPRNVTQAYVFLVPVSKGGELSYRTIPIEESEENTPKGGAFICNISDFKARVGLGDSGKNLEPGESVTVPQPTKRDAYNMSPFLVQMSDGKSWATLKDTPLRFSSRDRYFMFTYIKPKSNRPMVKIYHQSVPLNLGQPAAANP